MRIVLVRPRDPNNIGAAARAMANFGVGELVVVAPYEPVWREARSAVGAGPVLDDAREVATLDEAIAAATLVGATTATTRRRLRQVMTLPEFADLARTAAHPCLVFGNEKHGLTTAEIARCHAAVRIETDPRQPSMNLAHAVAVCCYALTVGRVGVAPTVAPRSERLATPDEIEHLLVTAFPHGGDARVEATRRAGRDRLRALLHAARASTSDVSVLHGILRTKVFESDNESIGSLLDRSETE